ncbi:MAG: hypothetical protein QXP91_12015 [Candidatus Methanomethylicia archaeon]
MIRNKEMKNILSKELEKLRRKVNYGFELKVVFKPKSNTDVYGEVKDGVIYVYVDDINEAIKTLRHEFIDYIVSKVIEPYRKTTNKLIELLNEISYRRKEEIVNVLMKLLD